MQTKPALVRAIYTTAAAGLLAVSLWHLAVGDKATATILAAGASTAVFSVASLGRRGRVAGA